MGLLEGTVVLSQHGLFMGIICCFDGSVFLLLHQIMKSLTVGGASLLLPTTTGHIY